MISCVVLTPQILLLKVVKVQASPVTPLVPPVPSSLSISIIIYLSIFSCRHLQPQGWNFCGEVHVKWEHASSKGKYQGINSHQLS